VVTTAKAVYHTVYSEYHTRYYRCVYFEYSSRYLCGIQILYVIGTVTGTSTIGSTGIGSDGFKFLQYMVLQYW
jgi:hypothetical protein